MLVSQFAVGPYPSSQCSIWICMPRQNNRSRHTLQKATASKEHQSYQCSLNELGKLSLTLILFSCVTCQKETWRIFKGLKICDPFMKAVSSSWTVSQEKVLLQFLVSTSQSKDPAGVPLMQVVF